MPDPRVPDPRVPDLLLLDTGVLIGGRAVLPPGVAVAVAALSIAELEFGLSAAAVRGDATVVRRRASRLASIRSDFGDGLPFDGAAALAYGAVTHAVLMRGRNPRSRAVDLMIAAVAVAAGAGLLTTQPHEFAGLDHLVVVQSVRG